MAAGAKAHESKKDPAAFQDPRDGEAIARFQGSFSGYERNRCFVAVGPGQYQEAGYELGLDLDHDGRATAAFDYDGDGDLDLAVLSVQGLRLFQNDAQPRKWLRLTVEGLGAVVRVGEQIDRVRLTAGFQTQVSPALHFGLGEVTEAEVSVTWPDGHLRRHTLKAGSWRVPREGAPSAAPLHPWPAEQRPRPLPRWSAELQAMDLRGGRSPLARPGQPLVLNFWASWCEPCQRELPALKALAAAHPELRVLAVNVEQGAREEVLAHSERLGIRPLVRLADQALVRSFFGEAQRVPLPTTFVFDRRGRPLRAFYREIDQASIEAVLAAADPLPPITDLPLEVQRLHQSGNAARALSLLEAVAERDPSPRTQSKVAQLLLSVGEPAKAERLLRGALRKAPRSVRLLATLAELQARGGDPKAAMKTIERALKIEPDNLLALNNRGLIFKSLGDHVRAAESFRRALELAPGYARARANLESLRR